LVPNSREQAIALPCICHVLDLISLRSWPGERRTPIPNGRSSIPSCVSDRYKYDTIYFANLNAANADHLPISDHHKSCYCRAISHPGDYKHTIPYTGTHTEQHAYTIENALACTR
jgi:hypothetical protein